MLAPGPGDREMKGRTSPAQSRRATGPNPSMTTPRKPNPLPALPPWLLLIGMPGSEERQSRYPQFYSKIGFAHQYRPPTRNEYVTMQP